MHLLRYGIRKAIIVVLAVAVATFPLIFSDSSWEAPIRLGSGPESITNSVGPEPVNYDPTTCQDIEPELEADRIVASENEALLPIAEQAYQRLLEQSPEDPCAVAGLARLKLLQDGLASAQLNEQSWAWAQRLSNDWTEWYEASMKPLGAASAFSAGLLILLLILGRLLTTAFVSTATGAPSKTHRRNMCGAGILLLVVASLTPAMAASSAVVFSGTSAWWPVVILAASGLCLTLLKTSHVDVLRRGWTRAAWCVGLVGLGSVALFWLVTRIVVPEATILLVAASLAVMGLTLTAFAWGNVLAVQVDVHDDAGTVDGSAGRLMTARLQTLGAHRPAGIHMPGPSDVTTLPEDALKTVPGGSVATLLFNILKVVRPAVPWRVLICAADQERHTLSITRNGRAVEEGSEVLTTSDIPGLAVTPGRNEGEDNHDVSAGAVTDELLTASAAHVLRILSLRHVELKEGMCGADTWKALALHAVAVRSSTRAARRKLLLATAIDASPKYILPRAAYLNTMEVDTAEGRLRYADKIDALWREYGKVLGGELMESAPTAPEKGYEAIQLRLLYNRAVGWANVRIDESLGGPGDSGFAASTLNEAWRSAAIAALALNRRLADVDPYWLDAGHTPHGIEVTQPLARRMRLTAAYVLHELSQRVPTGMDRLATQVYEWVSELSLANLPPPETRYDAYAYACLIASGSDQERTCALDWLEMSVTAQSLPEWAREDPSLAPFWRDGHKPKASPEQVRRFREILADAPIDTYLDLEPFKGHQEELRAFGMLSISDLLRVRPSEVAAKVGVHRSTARSWRRIAELYRSAIEPDWAGGSQRLEVLQALLGAGVSSVSGLRNAMVNREEFYREFVKNSKGLTFDISREETVCKWQRYQKGSD